MYPYHFTYLKRSEPGPSEVEASFREKYFPLVDRGIDRMECKERHPIDVVGCEGDRLSQGEVTPYTMELVPGEEELVLLRNDSVLPPPLDDIYNMHSMWCVFSLRRGGVNSQGGVISIRKETHQSERTVVTHNRETEKDREEQPNKHA